MSNKHSYINILNRWLWENGSKMIQLIKKRKGKCNFSWKTYKGNPEMRNRWVSVWPIKNKIESNDEKKQFRNNNKQQVPNISGTHNPIQFCTQNKVISFVIIQNYYFFNQNKSPWHLSTLVYINLINLEHVKLINYRIYTSS